jgi:hypothetical protein
MQILNVAEYKFRDPSHRLTQTLKPQVCLHAKMPANIACSNVFPCSGAILRAESLFHDMNAWGAFVAELQPDQWLPCLVNGIMSFSFLCPQVKHYEAGSESITKAGLKCVIVSSVEQDTHGINASPILSLALSYTKST